MKNLFSNRITQFQRGFSLVEIIVVLMLIIVLAGLTSKSLIKSLQTNQLTACIKSISSKIDRARAEAMSKNKYVWIAIANAPAGNENGLHIVVCSSTTHNDGISEPFQVIERVRFFHQVEVVNLQSQPEDLQAKVDEEVSSSKSYDLIDLPPIPPIQIQEVEFSFYLLFTPEGEVILPSESINESTPLIPYLTITLCQNQKNGKMAVILLNGRSGTLKTLFYE